MRGDCMRRWHSFLEIVQFPLITLLISTILMGIGGLITNPNLATLVTINHRTVIVIAELLRYFGGMMIAYFPLLILIKALSKRFDDSVPVYLGIIGYILFHISTMFFAPSNLPEYAYSNIMGIQVNLTQITLEGTGVRYPLLVGILGSIIIINITRYVYRRSRGLTGYGILTFIDKDTWAAMTIMVFSTIAGVIVSYLWPYFIAFLLSIYRFIAMDITNPINLLIYGISDRLLSVVGLARLIRTPFWFTELGGAWMDSLGNNYVGDVAIWTAQRARGIVSLGFGRLITPYYVLNIFAIPAFLIATYQTFTDKLVKRKYRLFVVIAIVLSILFGTLLPIEIFMVIVTPLLYFIHVLFSGILFALFEGLNVSIGYTFSGLEAVATPANIVDLLIFLRNPQMQRSLMMVLSVGVFTWIFYYFMTLTYFRKLAIDVLNIDEKHTKCDAISEAIGGIDNIRMVHSTPVRLTVLPYDKSKVDFTRTHITGLNKIVESRAGYAFSFGASSYMLRKEMIKRMMEYQKALLEQNINETD